MVATSEEVEGFEAQFGNVPDYKIKIEGYEWLVHKDVLAKRSKFFEKAFGGSFKESEEKVVVLHEDDPWFVALMILYFYSKDVEDSGRLRLLARTSTLFTNMIKKGGQASDFDETRKLYLEPTNELLPKFHGKLYKVAHKYGVGSLLIAVKSSLKAMLRQHPSMVLDLIDVIEAATVVGEKDLLESMFRAALLKSSKFSTTYERMKNYLEGYPSLFTEMGLFMQNQIKQHAEYRKDMLSTLKKTEDTLTPAVELMTYHPNNNPAKDKIREANELLTVARRKMQTL